MNINMNIFTNKTLLLDLFFSMLLAIIGFILIGYYLNYEYLLTGYQDWIYHAFRIKSISEFGITSWDHKWANGINYWQVYQYIPHLLALWLTKALAISPAKAIIYWTVAVFIYLRVAGYIVLRLAKIKPVYAFYGMALSFLMPQQWGAIREFSIYISLAVVPIFMFLWIKATRNHVLYILIAAIAGFSWSIHPLLGLTISSLVFFDLVISKSIRLILKITVLFIYIFSATSFFLEYLLTQYKFTHPYFTSIDFIVTTSSGQYLGLGLLFFILLSCCWLIFLIFSSKYEYWPKVLLVYCSLFLSIIQLAKLGLTPAILNILQFQRAHIIIGFFTTYVFGYSLNLLLNNRFNSFFKNTMLVALLAVLVVGAIDVNNSYSAIPVSSLSTPQINYFDNKSVAGSVFLENESEFSYFSRPEIRLVGSYNEHLLPGPTSYLIKRLLRPNIGYVDITDDQLQLVQDYMQVLGVEYLILPLNSPIVEQIKNGNASYLSLDGEINTENSIYSVVKNTRPISYAYVVDYKDYKKMVGDSALEDPTLNIQSIRPWNQRISAYSKFLQSENVVPLKMEFVHPNILKIHMPSSLPVMDDPVLMVNQSFDNNWTADTALDINPSELRLMKINIASARPSQIITLTNNWPKWHWIVEAIAPASVVITALGVGVFLFIKKGNINEN